MYEVWMMIMNMKKLNGRGNKVKGTWTVAVAQEAAGKIIK